MMPGTTWTSCGFLGRKSELIMSDPSTKQTLYVLRDWNGHYYSTVGVRTPDLHRALFFENLEKAQEFSQFVKAIGFAIYKVEIALSLEVMVHEIPGVKQ